MQPEIELWLDAQLSPAIALFIRTKFNVNCIALRDIGLRDASDIEIFEKAKQSKSPVILLTKDSDFTDILLRNPPPPKVILLSCGNTSNEVLKRILSANLQTALALLNTEENDIVEISD